MNRRRTSAMILVLALAGMALSPIAAQENGVEILLDFRAGSGGSWYDVDDDVMGGRSSSRMQRADGVGVFEGDLSLENNGGFASVRTDIAAGSLAGFSRLVLRVRGDGKRYQLRLRTTGAFDGIAYGAGFDTRAGEWTTVEIPVDAFEPTYRGYRPPNAAELDFADVRQIGIMLTDEQVGPFRLELEWIGVSADGVRPGQRAVPRHRPEGGTISADGNAAR